MNGAQKRDLKRKLLEEVIRTLDKSKVQELVPKGSNAGVSWDGQAPFLSIRVDDPASYGPHYFEISVKERF